MFYFQSFFCRFFSSVFSFLLHMAICSKLMLRDTGPADNLAAVVRVSLVITSGILLYAAGAMYTLAI